MSDDRDIAFAFLGLGAGIFLFFNGFRIFRKKQLIDNVPTSTVRGMAMGLVELSGRAVRGAPLKGPLSREDCAAYTYCIERYERRGKSSSWVTIAKGDSFHCSFDVEDETGKVTVMPYGVEFICNVRYFFETGLMTPLPPNLSGFMNNAGISYGGFFGNSRLRFTERNIQPGEPIYVLGTAKKTNAALADADVYKSKLAQRLNEVKGDAKFMAEIDGNKDGNVSDEEWQKAVMKIEHDLLQSEVSSAASSQLPDVVIARGDVERIFIISDKSQKELGAVLGWQVIGGVFGGAVVSVACLWYLLVRFHIF
ncbi:MAG: hypothetical protein IT395_05095 [Candidatus Omnitrophica bacterium]|nr:hypothetical protein [Candidatus Omnitrophota bacterium]